MQNKVASAHKNVLKKYLVKRGFRRGLLIAFSVPKFLVLFLLGWIYLAGNILQSRAEQFNDSIFIQKKQGEWADRQGVKKIPQPKKQSSKKQITKKTAKQQQVLEAVADKPMELQAINQNPKPTKLHKEFNKYIELNIFDETDGEGILKQNESFAVQALKQIEKQLITYGNAGAVQNIPTPTQAKVDTTLITQQPKTIKDINLGAMLNTTSIFSTIISPPTAEVTPKPKTFWQDVKINLSSGFDLFSVNNIKNTGFVNRFNLKSKYITSDTRGDFNISDISASGANSTPRKTEVTNIFSDTRFEINDLDFFKLRNFRNLFGETQNLQQDAKFEPIDILKYTFISLYSRSIITNERNAGNFDQKDIINAIGPGAKYKIFYLSAGFGKAIQTERIDVSDLSKGYETNSRNVMRVAASLERQFKYLTVFDDEIKIKGELSYNQIKNFSTIIQRNISISKRLDKYSTINIFYMNEDIFYKVAILNNQNTNRRRISLSFLFNFF